MNIPRLIASGFGSGLAPVAPGTFGSLAGLAIGAAAISTWHPALPIAALAAAIGGIWAIQKSAVGDNDPGWVVIDEIAGQLIAMLPIAHLSPWQILAAFALFRFFDITKLGPIGWADRRHDAYGVVGDDLIAGLASAAVLWPLIHAFG